MRYIHVQNRILAFWAMIQPSIYEVYNGGLVCPAMSGRRGKVHLHTSRQRPPLRRCAGRCRCWSGGVKVAPDPHSFCWLQLPWHRLQTVAYVGPFPGWMMLERWHFALLQVLLFQQIISSLSRSPHNRHLPETVSSIWGFMVRGHGQGFVKHLLCVCPVIGTSSFVLIG